MLKHISPELSALAEYNQFILWFPVRRPDGKIDKFPVNYRTGQVSDPHDPAAWMSAQEAEQQAARYGGEYYIGYVFTENDPFFFVDIDDALLPDGSGWNQSALFLCDRLQGALIEISYSGTGLHIIGRGRVGPHRCNNEALNTDFYTERRFIALTGWSAVGSAGLDCSQMINQIAGEYFPATLYDPAEWTAEPVENYNFQGDDNQLIERALASKSVKGVFGKGCTFKDLWEANTESLSEAYPPNKEYHDYDASKADAALAQHLAFWTGKNCERIYLLMWRSALVREKWEQRDDYLQRTIVKAAAMQSDVYTAGPLKEISAPVDSVMHEPQIVSGYQYLGASMQLEHFKGCVYVQDINKVFTPSGAFLKKEQFNATYGGYVFQLDETGDKPTRRAWEAFTESQLLRWPKATSKCFRPELPTGQLIEEEKQVLVNTYVPINTEMHPGDVSLFLDHLSRILPNERDRVILLSYMAACIQHKGVKFQWAPLLQGTEGNGKTLFTRCVIKAIGERYAHLPPASEVSEKFNEWLFEKLFIGLEDVYVPEHKTEVIETLKPMITNEKHAKRAMQQSQVMGDNRANFLLNSNHKDAIRKTHNDRRFCVFYTAQQSADDLGRFGMTGDYFPNLYDWLKLHGGYSNVSYFLNNYEIPEQFNPATQCHRAPRTSSTDEAITAGLGSVEQEVLEAIEEGRPGFSGGWVSSVALERLLQLMRMSRAVPHNKRRDLLKALGYDWHPGLNRGRVNNPLMTDEGKKPVLFIRNGHIHANLRSGSEISRHYQEAQGMVSPSGGGVGGALAGN